MPSVFLWASFKSKAAFQEGGDICMHIADSLHCTAETKTTL